MAILSHFSLTLFTKSRSPGGEDDQFTKLTGIFFSIEAVASLHLMKLLNRSKRVLDTIHLVSGNIGGNLRYQPCWYPSHPKVQTS